MNKVNKAIPLFATEITSTVQVLVKLKDIVKSHIMNFVEIQKLWLNICNTSSEIQAYTTLV